MRERYRSWSRSATNCTPRSHPIRISPRKKSRPISARSSSLIYRKDRSSLNGKKQGDLEWLTHERYAHSIPRSDPRTNPRRRIDLIRCFLASGTRVKWIRDFSPVPIPEYFIASPLERSPKFRHVRQFLESLLFFVVFYSLLFLSPSYRYRTTRDPYSYISRTRGFVSNAATTSYYTDFWKPRQRVERRAWPAFPLRRSLRSRQFRSRIERYVLPMISKSYALSFSNYNDI